MSKQKSLLIARKYQKTADIIQDQIPESNLLSSYAKQLSVFHALENSEIQEEASRASAYDATNIQNKILNINQQIRELTDSTDFKNINNDISTQIKKNSLFRDLLKTSMVAGAVLAVLYAPYKAYKNSLSQTWKAEYYANSYLDGIPLITAFEQNPDFSWETTAPSPEMPTDNFSAKWESILDAKEDLELHIDVIADDGVRVYVDSEIVIDAWKKQFRAVNSANKSLAIGKHNIKIEYFEGGGGAMIKTKFRGLKPDSEEEVSLQFIRPE